MRTKAAVTALGAALVLLSCGAAEEPDADQGQAPLSFADLLGMTADTDGDRGDKLYSIDVFYGDQAQTRRLIERDDRGWASLDAWGSGVFGPGTDNATELKEYTGIDVSAATTLYAAGVDERRVVFVSGNQDTEAIAETATANGWERDGDTLRLDVTGDDPRGVELAAQIRLRDDAVVLGIPGVDMDRLSVEPGDTQSLLDDPAYATVSSCIGDPVAARIAHSDEIGSGYRGTDAAYGLIAVGLFADGDDGEPATTVVCATSEDPQSLADGIIDSVANDRVTNLGDDYYSDWVSDVDVTVDGDLVRAVFMLSDGVDAGHLLTSMRHPGPPGFR